MNILRRPILMVMMLTLTMAFDWGAATAYGQGSVIRKPAQEVIEGLGRYFSRTGGRELTEELAKFGGEAAVRRVAKRAFREGGDDALNALVRTARSHGPDALRAADNAVNIPRLLRAIDDLPEEMASQAIRRLGAGAEGRLLAETAERFGAQALRAEVRHPGIGGNLVRHLGDDGAAFASQASRQQAITISRHADDIARIPEAERAGVLRILREDFDRGVAFMGRFIERNPGKVLFTAATTTLVLANPDKVLGGEGEIEIGPDGDPVYVPKPGPIERIVKGVVKEILAVMLPIIALVCVIWLAVKLWFHYRLTKLKYQVDAFEVTANSVEKKTKQEWHEKERQGQQDAAPKADKLCE